MELNEKKPKRPRIGQHVENENTEHYREENTSQTDTANTGASNESGENHRGFYRPYQRPYNNYNQGERNGNYQNRTPHPQPNRNYQPRQYNENGEGRQGGYNNYNNRQGGYNRQQGGYNNGQQNGYNNGQQRNYNRQGGYNNNYSQQQKGYNNRPNGFNNRQQGSYNRQQGGFNQGQQRNFNRQGGYNNRPNNGSFQMRGKSFTPRPKRIEYETVAPAPDEQIRLNKYLANAGLCSRREADEYIQSGRITVNGKPATELGTKITHSDVVEFNGKVVTLENKCYIVLNKPKDCVTTSDDPNGRLTVMDLVKGACQERIYPVGRLDRNTTGVILLTNDGDLASKLTHPQYVKKKIYHVWTDKDVTEDDMQRIADGIELEDGEIHADAISYATETDRNQIGIEIHSGRNRIVRRIFESLGYHVTKLDRVYFAGLTKKNLPRGRWRYLTQQEVNFLKMGSFE